VVVCVLVDTAVRVAVCVLIEPVVSVEVLVEMNVSVVVEREIGTSMNAADTRIAVMSTAEATNARLTFRISGRVIFLFSG
jgi:hypothetical protein